MFDVSLSSALTSTRYLQRPQSGVDGDITYIAIDEGWLYLSVVSELFSRQVMGWIMHAHMQNSLVTAALYMAWVLRTPDAGVILHSDRGNVGQANPMQFEKNWRAKELLKAHNSTAKKVRSTGAGLTYRFKHFKQHQ